MIDSMLFYVGGHLHYIRAFSRLLRGSLGLDEWKNMEVIGL